MKVNWNMKATVKLNCHGRDIHQKYFRDLSKFAGAEIKPPKGDYRPEQLEEPLWSIAQIFGPHLFNGCKSPFETMNFELEDVISFGGQSK